MRRPTCKGEGREEKEGEGKERWREGKGERRSGCNNFPFTPETPIGEVGALHPAGGLAPDPQLLPALPSDPGDATGHM